MRSWAFGDWLFGGPRRHLTGDSKGIWAINMQYAGLVDSDLMIETKLVWKLDSGAAIKIAQRSGAFLPLSV